jgi:hypothetical protein
MNFHLEDLLLIEVVNNGEYNRDDLEREIEQMFIANKKIQEFYDYLKEGSLNPGYVDEFCDLLFEIGGVEPYEWLNNTTENVRYLLDSGIAYKI